MVDLETNDNELESLSVKDKNDSVTQLKGLNYEDSSFEMEQTDDSTDRGKDSSHADTGEHDEMVLEKEDDFGVDWLSHEFTKQNLDQKSKSSNMDDSDPVNSSNFHKDSKSPKFYKYEIKHPDEGVKYLVGKAYNVEAKLVTEKECEFALKMLDLLNRLTQKETEILAYCMLQAVNANNEELTIFKNI